MYLTLYLEKQDTAQQSIIPTYPCIFNVASKKTSKEMHWSSSRIRHSEVKKCWNLHSSIFTLYFLVQFIIMWWDNIFTQVHSSFQIENGVCSTKEKLSKKLSLSCLWFLIFATTDFVIERDQDSVSTLLKEAFEDLTDTAKIRVRTSKLWNILKGWNKLSECLLDTVQF